MNKKDHIFFPPAPKDGVLEELLTEFPFPLALTYKRLQEEMDRQEPIAAAWQLRDSFECLLKFTASLALADCLQAQPGPEKAGRLVSLLLKERGLAVGDWHTLLEGSLKPLKQFATDNRLNESHRCLPSLVGCFFTPTGSRTPLNRKIDGDKDSFISWRNRVFGHGVFQQERQFYAEQTLNWLGTLREFYVALAPVLKGWALVSTTAEGEEVVWQGAGDQPGWVRHQHDPLGEPRSMFMRATEGKRLPMGPLLSVQECALCGQPATFFFDRHNRKKGPVRTHFLEYFRGHEKERRNWEEVLKWAALLPPDFKWERSVYDPQEVVEGLRIVFRDFESEYLRPDYLIAAIWQQVEAQGKGYIHLMGRGQELSGSRTGAGGDGTRNSGAVLPHPAREFDRLSHLCDGVERPSQGEAAASQPGGSDAGGVDL